MLLNMVDHVHHLPTSPRLLPRSAEGFCEDSSGHPYIIIVISVVVDF